MQDTLYLGSQSSSRQKLLRDAGIRFAVASHTSDENVIRGDLPFNEYVMKIAQEKMRHVVLDQSNCRYVLTADTLVHLPSSGLILGKPKDREDAKNMIRAMRHEVVEVVTGCCLQKYGTSVHGTHVVASATWTTGALIEFHVDEEFIDAYFDKEPYALSAAGSCIVDSGYGQSFFKRITGSYSAVIGLPLFELRQELLKMGFIF